MFWASQCVRESYAQGQIYSFGGLEAIKVWIPLSVRTQLGYDKYFVLFPYNTHKYKLFVVLESICLNNICGLYFCFRRPRGGHP
jgi:hypothetical protein